jgi:CRISPR-associated protein Csb2
MHYCGTQLKRKPHTHAVLIFDRPIGGPIFIGAGRYQGYGLCRPLENA